MTYTVEIKWKDGHESLETYYNYNVALTRAQNLSHSKLFTLVTLTREGETVVKIEGK